METIGPVLASSGGDEETGEEAACSPAARPDLCQNIKPRDEKMKR